MPNLSIVLGPPLSGKTTFVQSLVNCGAIHICVGKICRDEARKNTKLGRLINESIQYNIFLDSDILLPFLLDGRLEDKSKEFVLDGYPKYKHETEPLLKYCSKNNIQLYRLYHLQIKLSELLRRLNNRYTCDSCYLPLKRDIKCECGGCPFKREEDTEEYFMNRYARYCEHSGAILRQLLPHFKEEIIHV